MKRIDLNVPEWVGLATGCGFILFIAFASGLRGEGAGPLPFFTILGVGVGTTLLVVLVARWIRKAVDGR
jgi:hypothetical protein